MLENTLKFNHERTKTFIKKLTANGATSEELGRPAKKFMALSVSHFHMPVNSFCRFQLHLTEKTRPTRKRGSWRMRKSRRRQWSQPNASHQFGLVPIDYRTRILRKPSTRVTTCNTRHTRRTRHVPRRRRRKCHNEMMNAQSLKINMYFKEDFAWTRILQPHKNNHTRQKKSLKDVIMKQWNWIY